MLFTKKINEMLFTKKRKCFFHQNSLLSNFRKLFKGTTGPGNAKNSNCLLSDYRLIISGVLVCRSVAMTTAMGEGHKRLRELTL